MNDEDVDSDAGLVRIRGKGKKERLAPLGSYAMRALDNWYQVRELAANEPTDGQAPVFVNRFGHRLRLAGHGFHVQVQPAVGRVDHVDQPRAELGRF